MTDIAVELAKLHILNGADFIRQLRLIVTFREFRLVEAGIYSAMGEDGEDYPALMNAARKAVAHGYTVYIRPNPKGIRTADFIFERKGVYKMYDLKTIQGKSSVFNRLIESMGQTNHVLLHLNTDYNARLMGLQIRHYFETNPSAMEVLIFKGKSELSIHRRLTQNPLFLKQFKRMLEK